MFNAMDLFYCKKVINIGIVTILSYPKGMIILSDVFILMLHQKGHIFSIEQIRLKSVFERNRFNICYISVRQTLYFMMFDSTIQSYACMCPIGTI